MRTDISTSGDNLSAAWAHTVLAVADEPKHRACHVVTRIDDPYSEDPDIRLIADGILAARDLPPVDTVANTLFPSNLAARSSGPAALGERYVRLLPTLKKLDPENCRGTYFERLVDYKTSDGSINQITELVRRLNVEKATPGPKTARYEVALEQLTASLPVQNPERDTNPIGFPCLSLLSFQLDDERLHVVAHYRSHYLFQRAYGNYLAVCQLLRYVCTEAALLPGQVTIVAGYAQVDQHRASSINIIRDYLDEDQLRI